MLVVVVLLLMSCFILAFAVIALYLLTTDEGGGEDKGGDGLPPPSPHDARCVTYMSSPQDTGDCFALVYNHCTPGYTNQSGIPPGIRSAKARILKQIRDINSTHFDKGKPDDWTTVCVARPDRQNTAQCKYVTPGEVRVWVKGRQDLGTPECPTSGSLYIKAHFNTDASIQGDKTGTVGHG